MMAVSGDWISSGNAWHGGPVRQSRVLFANGGVNGYSVVSAWPDNHLLFTAQVFDAGRGGEAELAYEQVRVPEYHRRCLRRLCSPCRLEIPPKPPDAARRRIGRSL